MRTGRRAAVAAVRFSAAFKATRDVIVDMSDLRFADPSLMIDLACLAQRLRASGTLDLAAAPAAARAHADRARRARPPALGAGRHAARPPPELRFIRAGSLSSECRLLLVILFIVVPIAELAVIIQVGQAIGVWWTIALLVADSVLGAWLMRSQGRAAWRRFVGPSRAPGCRRARWPTACS